MSSPPQTSAPNPLVHHQCLHFTGHVQGVGFRYTALQVAREYEIAGTVANLPDGRVRLEVEGAEPEIAAFVAALRERMFGHIRAVDSVATQAPSRHQGFNLL